MKQVIALGVGVALLAGYLGYSGLEEKEVQQPAATAQVVEETPKQQQELVISEDKEEVSYQGVAGETALATLQNLTDTTIDESSFGEFVSGINGLGADANSEYWAFYINDELAAVGAGSYEAEEGDTFTWRLETF